MAASVSSSINLLECPTCIVAPANEEQRAPGLVVQLVTLGVPCGNKFPAQLEPTQEQGVGKVGWHEARMPTHAWWSALLSGMYALIMVVVHLVVVSVNDLAPVASRVIRWASTWNRPVLSAVTMVCLAWTWHGQAQWLWVSACTLVHRHTLRPHPATYGNLGRDRGVLEANQGLS